MHSQKLDRGWAFNKSQQKSYHASELTELQVLSEMRELVPTVAFHHHLTAGGSNNFKQQDNN